MANSIDRLSEFSLLAKKNLPAAQKSKIKTAYPNNKLKNKLKEAVKNCYDPKSMTYPTYPYYVKNKTDQELKEALLELKYTQVNNPKDVKSLQYLLMRWMPALKNKLKINGIFDENTKNSLEYFKKIYNLGEDGTKLEEKSAQAFIDIRNGDFWKEPLKYPKTEIGEKIYQILCKYGAPYFDSIKFHLTDQEFKDLVEFDPKIKEYYLKNLTKLKLNSSNNNSTLVKMLQNLLLKWMPNFKDNLKVNGVYERKTQVALEYFKKLYGFGKDGSAMDAKTSQALVDLKLDNFKDYELTNDNAKIIYDLMKKTGFPYNSRNIVLEDEQIKAVADFDPHRLISCQTYGMEIQDKINKSRWVPGEVYEMQALTAKRFLQLHKDFEENFPNYHLTVTSTTGGSHIDPNHRDGKAIDFIYVNAKGHPVEDIKYKDGKVISLYNENLYIKYLEPIVYKNGFIPFNEYIHNSPHKTGPHMHIDFNDEIKKKKN